MPKPHILKQSEVNRDFLLGHKMKIVKRTLVMTALAVPIAIGSLANGFDKMDLQKLKLTKACERCNLSGANLREAELSEAILAYANLIDAELGRANLSFASLRGSDLAFANMRQTNLGVANLRGANLYYADLRRANLHKANLSGANLYGANLSSANLKDATLEGALFCKTKMPWGEDHSDCAE